MNGVWLLCHCNLQSVNVTLEIKMKREISRSSITKDQSCDYSDFGNKSQTQKMSRMCPNIIT